MAYLCFVCLWTQMPPKHTQLTVRGHWEEEEQRAPAGERLHRSGKYNLFFFFKNKKIAFIITNFKSRDTDPFIFMTTWDVPKHY